MPALSHRSSIYDLTARDSASIGLPHAPLLIEAFKAILDKDEKLPPTFDESSSTKIVLAQSGVSWRAAIHGAISALERNPHFFVGWFRSVFVDQTDYRRWRDEKSKQRIPTQAQRPRRPSFKVVLAGIQEYLDLEQAEGRSGSQKRAWGFAKVSIPGATYSQTIEALLIAEGRRKPRGRPRAQSKQTTAS